MRKRMFLVLGVASSVATGVTTQVAEAQSLSDCGQIQLEAEASCELTGGITCEAMCTPISVQAACAAELTASCDARCDNLPSIDCQGSCEADCSAECSVAPGRFDCAGACQADCSGGCSARCEASANRSQCEASCAATCGASCRGKCEVEAPMADCDAKCSASCEGSCEADANLDCQIDCQGEAYASCEVKVEGGCEAACEAEQGALFCDGQYVDHGDHLDRCVAALEAALDIQVEGYAEGSSSCNGGSCQAEGEAGVSCSAWPRGPSRSGPAWLSLAAIAGVSVMRRRRR